MRGVNLANRNASGSVWQSPIGGICQKMINGTAGASIKGEMVSVDATADNSVIATPLTTTGPIGVFYEEGIAVGDEAWVVTEGIAEVALNDNVAIPGDYVRVPVVGDAAIAVAEVVEMTFTGPAAAIAGSLGVKLPSLASVPVAIAGGENAAAVAALVAAEAFAGWTPGAVGAVVTFTQTVEATTDGVMGITPGTTTITATTVATALGKPAITPAAGIAVAAAGLPADGTQLGICIENHTARPYADGVFTAKCILKSN